MPYSPPSATAGASWVGAPAYRAPAFRLVASWNEGGQRWISPGGAAQSELGASASLLQHTPVKPPGIASWCFGATFALRGHGQAYRPAQFVLPVSWSEAAAYSAPAGAFLRASWDNSRALIAPAGIHDAAVPEPTLYWAQFVEPYGWDALGSLGRHYALHPYEYPPPQWSVDASWVGREPYAPLAGVVNAAWALPQEAKQVSLTGWQSSAAGAPRLHNFRSYVGAAGIAAPPASTTHHVALGAAGIHPRSFITSVYGRPHVWNWRQYLPIRGFDAQRIGEHHLQGGVKTVFHKGLDQSVVPRPLVVNTMGEQFVTLGHTHSIPPPPVPLPVVRPYIVWPRGILATGLGEPQVQFPPRPVGWQSSTFGYATIEYKTRWARPGGIDSFVTGYPVVRDRALRILHKSQITTEIFGDILLQLKNARIRLEGIDSEHVSRWAEARNTRRPLLPPGFVATLFGGSAIRNKTPALWPVGFESLRIGSHDVGYSVRHVYPAGAIPPYPHTGHHSLWQTPSLAPRPIAAPALPAPVVWPRVREVIAGSWLSERIGAAWADFRWRRVVAEGRGIDGLKAGAPRVEHADRRIPPLGRDFLAFGGVWVSRGQRVVDLVEQGIEYPYMHNHRVGYTREVAPFGFEATRWLTTIVPEAQDIHPKSFGALYGWPKVEHYKRYLRLEGITTYPEPQMHWGDARVWNLRQIITQVEDQQSGLWPPAGSQWTRVENRNRAPRASGWVATRYGNTHVELGARAILAQGIGAPALPEWQETGTVTHRVRPVLLEGLEPPLVGRWGVVWNKADPLYPPGLLATLFGRAELVNTRRYRRIEGFTPDAYGYPLVAYRIRELTFESRYGIQPPVIALPLVFHHTRYMEPPSIDEPKASVLHILESRFNRIVTKWTQQHDLFGWAALRNVTPEVKTHGRAADEWGEALVRLQWRPLRAEGANMQLFGQAVIADRTRTIQVPGRNFLVMGQLIAKRIGADPVVTQYIDLRVFIIDPETRGQIEADRGYGIDIPQDQVPRPDLTKGYVFPDSQGSNGNMQAFGKPHVTANTIRVEPGYWDLLVGEPTVSLKRRVLEVKTIGQLVEDGVQSGGGYAGSWGKPRLSPHTVYAVLEAPAQAMRNHGIAPTILHPVNSGIRIGAHRVTQYLGQLKPSGIPDRGPSGNWGAGRPEVWSTRRYVHASGFNMMRVGFPVIPGAQTIEVEEPGNETAVGRPTVAPPPPPPRVLATGLAAFAPPRPVVDFYHRTVRTQGWLSQLMDGRSGAGGTMNMPQRLHVGPPNLHEQVGFAATAYGNAWASHRVREVVTQGHDSFACEYDLENFDKRMRVRNADDRWPGRQIITAHGHRSSRFGHAELRSGRHYIRPDGNAEQYRKGAPTT